MICFVRSFTNFHPAHNSTPKRMLSEVEQAKCFSVFPIKYIACYSFEMKKG